MSRLALFALLSLILSLCPFASLRAGPITYDLNNYPDQQNGWTLSGTITTDGTIGTLTYNNIMAWNFTETKGTTVYGLSSTQRNHFIIDHLTATSTQLTLASTSSCAA
jgi:hypothetical protein